MNLFSELTVRRGDAIDSDRVVITVVNRYLSGVMDGSDYCAKISLGGPTTYPVDSIQDGAADICLLGYTRREAVARQFAGPLDDDIYATHQ